MDVVQGLTNRTMEILITSREQVSNDPVKTPSGRNVN